MIKRIVIIVFVDLLFVYLLISIIHPDPSVTLALIIIIPCLILSNLLLGILLKIKGDKWYFLIFLNGVFVSLLFSYGFSVAVRNHVDEMYKIFNFSFQSKKYQIILNNQSKDSSFDLLELENGSSSGVLNGHYLIKNDSIILLYDKGKVMTIHRNTLTDYPNKGDKISLIN